jgi:hypothetical protein
MPKKQNDELKLCLIVEMVIESNGVGEQLIRNQILSVIDHAVDGGIITGTSDAELIAHKAYISRFTRDPREIPDKAVEEPKDKEAVA